MTSLEAKLPVLLDEWISGYDTDMSSKPADAVQTPSGDPPPDRVRVVTTPGICGGKPRIDGHRITVEDIAIWHERMGMSADEIVSAHPGLCLSDVHGALAYYFEHRDRIDADIGAGERFVEQIKASAPPSLVQEKLRQRNGDAQDDPLSSR